MLYFIGYIFKIIISLVVGFIIGHNFKTENEDDNKVVLYTSVLSFMATSLSAVLINLNFANSSVVIGFLLFGLFFLIESFIKDFNSEDKVKLIFSAVNGLIIGFGFIFYSLLVTVVFVYIFHNVNIFLSLFIKNDKNKSIDSDSEENL